MLRKIFFYTMRNVTTLIKKLSVKDQVLTLYSDKVFEEDECHCDAPKDFNYLNLLREHRESRFNLKGQPYLVLHKSDLSHQVLDLHHDALDSNTFHVHLAASEMFTPSKLNHTVNEIVAIQAKEAARTKFHAEAKAIFDFGQLIAAGFGIKTLAKNVLPLDATYQLTGGDYISDADAVSVAEEFQKYYDTNQAILEAQYNQNQKVIHHGWYEIDSGVKQGILFGLFVAIIRECLLKSGASRQACNRVLSGLAITWMLYSAEEYTASLAIPVLLQMALSFMPHLDDLKGRDGMKYTDDFYRMIFAVGLMGLTSGFSFLNFLKTFMSSGVATIASVGVAYVSDTLFSSHKKAAQIAEVSSDALYAYHKRTSELSQAVAHLKKA